MIINHNIAALNTHRQLGSAQSAQMNSMEKLSSGMRINSAKDDAAGLSISEKMRGQIRGLEQASANAQDGISLMQTAEGALNEVHSILQRQRELVVQAGNEGTLQGDDLKAIQDEIKSLNDELTGISERTEFNGKKLLDGSFDAQFQIGANTGQKLDLKVNSDAAGTLGFSSSDLGVGALVTPGATAGDPDVVDTTAGIQANGTSFDADIALVDAAIKNVSSARSNLGANQNRLEHTINNLGTSAENLTAAESRIRDVDYAEAA